MEPLEPPLDPPLHLVTFWFGILLQCLFMPPHMLLVMKTLEDKWKVSEPEWANQPTMKIGWQY